MEVGACMMNNEDEGCLHDLGGYQRTQMQKEIIIQKLKDRGGRVTKQRLMLLDIILEDECSCCKEIYYKAAGKNEKIGLATVYRMVNTLEEIGAISRKNMYKVVCDDEGDLMDVYKVEFDDGTITQLSAKDWYQVVRAGLKEYGYLQDKELHSVRARTCDCSRCCDSASVGETIYGNM